MDFVEPLKPRNPDGVLRDAEDLGQIMRARREELGYTQVQLARACHCSPRFIGDLERGVAGGNIKQVIKICKNLGIDLFARVRGR
jgi:transcriptional regulator with XRE-family HTH domain